MSKQNIISATTLLLVMFGIIAILIASQGTSEKSAKESDTELGLAIEQNAKELFVKKAPSLNLKANPSISKDELEKLKEDSAIEPLEYEVDKYVTKYVNVSSLNVRKGPSVDYGVVGSVVQNQKVKAEVGDGQSDWLKVKTSEFIGFVNGNYLSDEPVKSSEEQEEQIENLKGDTTKDKGKTEKQKNEKSTNDNESNSKGKSETSKTKEEAKTEPNEPIVDQKPKNDAEKLQSIDGNNQLILVTTNGFNTSSARVQTFERSSNGNWIQVLSVSGYIGKNGFSNNKVEGDGKSPTGKYSIGTAFGRSGNPGTKLAFRKISSDDIWVDDANSSLYNTWQSRKETEGQWDSAENMDISAYTYGFVINYNSNRVPGLGSAIFFHVSNGHTLGCTGVSQSNVVSILKWLNPSKKPVIIQTPISELGKY